MHSSAPCAPSPGCGAALLQVTGGADLFIGFGGVVERPAVRAGADWYVKEYTALVQSLKRYTVRPGH
jgi:hypothetical protein